MRLKSLSACALVLCAAACGGSHSSPPAAEFGGEYTSAVAFFQTLVPSAVSVFLFADYNVTCDAWQSAPYSGDYIELDVGADKPGNFSVVAPSTNGVGTGQADALAYLGADKAASTGGSIALSQVVDGQTLTGSGQVTWDDGESLIIDQFSATYCPAVPTPSTFQGTLTPMAAFYDNGAGTTNEAGLSLFFLSQTMDCSSWQQNPPPLSSNSVVLELDVYATVAGQYSIVEAVNPANETATALIALGTSQTAPEMDAASGSVTVSAVNPNSTVAVSNIEITWNDATHLQVGAFTATYCPLSQ